MRPRLAAATLAALALSACSPGAPDGVSKTALDTAVNDAVGDPNTCVLIGKTGGGVVYQYGTHEVCGASWPACQGSASGTVGSLLAVVAKGGAPVEASCPSNPDGSRGVAWAAGPVEGQALVYAARMEGPTIPPGRVIAEKLKAAFKRAGL
jgi:hypothetical protein